DDAGVKQVFRVDQGVLRRAAGNRHGLAELGGGLHVVDATADQAGLGQDHTVLAFAPAVADADGTAILERNRSADRAWKRMVHGKSPGVILCVALCTWNTRGSKQPGRVCHLVVGKTHALQQGGNRTGPSFAETMTGGLPATPSPSMRSRMPRGAAAGH